MTNSQNLQSQQDDSEMFSIQDILSACLSKWKWFVLSIAVCLSVAVIYLLRTPSVYTRTTSVLIKEDGKGGGGGFASEMNAFAEMGLFRANTNVYNELATIQSPNMLMEVIRRLNLQVDYKTDGTFHKKTLYGLTLPVRVEFQDLAYNDFSTFTLTLKADGTFTLSDFKINGEKAVGAESVLATEGEAVSTPIGRLVVSKTANFSEETAPAGMDIYVSRSGLLSTVTACQRNMVADLHDKKNGTIVDISYTDVSIQRAEDFLNTLISAYNEDWVKDKNQIAVSTSQFINERLLVIEKELGNVDSDISEFKSENLIPDIQAVSQMHLATANQVNMQITELNNQLYMARYIREYINNKNSRNQLLPANSGISAPIIEQQINEYNDKMLQRNSMVANSSVENPLVVDMDQALSEMRSAIVVSIDNQINNLNTQIQALRGIEGSSISQLSSNPKQSQHLLSVERQQKVKEALYLFLLERREENELSQAFTAYNTKVITSPTGDLKPTSPRKGIILLAAFAIGFLLPAVVIYLMESMNTKVRGRSDIEKLSIPYLGEIPFCGSRKSKKRKGKSQPKRIVVKEGNRDVVNEAFRVVRTNIEFMAGKAPNHVFIITSFMPGSGKSFLTMNLAVSLAIKKKSVLVIDGDMRHASSSAYVGSPKLGLADFLSGKVDNVAPLIIKDEKRPTFHVLPVGTIPPNPAELLFDDRLADLITQVRSQYEYIFIDCPPMNVVADTQIIERVADRTIFVIRTGLLDKKMLPEVEALYREQKLKNMAVLLNGTELGAGRYGSRYGYGYGYGGGEYYASTSNQRGGGKIWDD